MKKHNANVRYICDPVFGDNGKLYVPAELVGIYKKDVIPLSNIVTPNQFEVEQLTGITVNTMEDAIKATNALHQVGPEIVVITSMLLQGKKDTISIIASQRLRSEDGTSEDHLWCIETPVLDGSYTGTGDVTAALILAWSAKDPSNLGIVLEKTVSTMYKIIETTMKQRDGTVAGKELKLIESKGIIENPPTTFKAKKLS
jgi:pyridoxine kinase